MKEFELFLYRCNFITEKQHSDYLNNVVSRPTLPAKIPAKTPSSQKRSALSVGGKEGDEKRVEKEIDHWIARLYSHAGHIHPSQSESVSTLFSY